MAKKKDERGTNWALYDEFEKIYKEHYNGEFIKFKTYALFALAAMNLEYGPKAEEHKDEN